MYKIKERLKRHLFKYAKTKLDLNSSYDKETWNKAGFKDEVLELIK